MVTISLCMIVKNEERVLGRCLESVQEIADEIIIVDTGSEDRTKKIAEKYHARVFEQEWQDDFSRARNYSFSQAEMDYCMWLDADDIITKSEVLKLKRWKEETDGSSDVVMIRSKSTCSVPNSRQNFCLICSFTNAILYLSIYFKPQAYFPDLHIIFCVFLTKYPVLLLLLS